MQDKTYRTEVRTDSDYDEVPSVAVFAIDEDTAREIITLAALVKDNKLYKVEKFDYRARFYCSVPEEDPEEAEDAGEEERTEADTLNVSESEFWFSAYLKHTNVEVLTEKQPIVDLFVHFGFDPTAKRGNHDEVPVGTAGKLVTLDGKLIVGTHEIANGVAYINSARRNPDGGLEFEYSGETRGLYDTQQTATNAVGETLFETENGEIIPSSQIKLVGGIFIPLGRVFI